MTRSGATLLGLAGLLAAGAPVTPAATLVVDADGSAGFSTVQAAIDAAAPALDQVLVRCGVYEENITMRDGVSVAGEHPTCAVLDGSQAGSVVTMIGVGTGTVLRGLTIRNGRADFGGGIYIEDSAAMVTGNRIVGNATNLFGSGGGIFIAGSLAVGGQDGLVITGNLILDNVAEETGGGIEVFSGSGTLISNNVVEGNTAAVAGGGICVLGGSHTLRNNTVLGNCRQGGQTACDLGGGGIAVATADPVDLGSNVIAFNEAAFGGGGVDVTNGAVAFASNDVFGNQPVDYAGMADPTGQDGNLSVDPLLVGADGTFRGYQPRSDSSLLDASIASPPEIDLRGVSRPRDGDADGVAAADIGARENEGLTRLVFRDSPSDLGWDPGATATYHVYRGSVAHLRETGSLLQDPATVAGAGRWCEVDTPDLADTENPASDGEGFFYLAAASGAAHGSLGLDSRFTERAYDEDRRCP